MARFCVQTRVYKSEYNGQNGQYIDKEALPTTGTNLISPSVGYTKMRGCTCCYSVHNIPFLYIPALGISTVGTAAVQASGSAQQERSTATVYSVGGISCSHSSG